MFCKNAQPDTWGSQGVALTRRCTLASGCQGLIAWVVLFADSALNDLYMYIFVSL